MVDSITISNQGWTIRFTLCSWEFGYLKALMTEIAESSFNWDSFNVDNKLWFNDGLDYLTCKHKDSSNKYIEFMWQS